jgi:hypothetical protein
MKGVELWMRWCGAVGVYMYVQDDELGMEEDMEIQRDEQ